MRSGVHLVHFPLSLHSSGDPNLPLQFKRNNAVTTADGGATAAISPGCFHCLQSCLKRRSPPAAPSSWRRMVMYGRIHTTGEVELGSC